MQGAYHAAAMEALDYPDRCVVGCVAGTPLGLSQDTWDSPGHVETSHLASCLLVLLSVWEGSRPSSLPVCTPLAAQVRPWLDPLSCLPLDILERPVYRLSPRFPLAGHPVCR